MERIPTAPPRPMHEPNSVFPSPLNTGRKSTQALLWCLLVPGLAAVIAYLGWWIVQIAEGALWAIPGLILSLAYILGQLLPSWLLYLAARPARTVPAWPQDLTVDVFVTAYKEPVAMVEECIAAACAMRGKHETYLLDDGSDPALEALAARYGARYLTRPGGKDAKAGNMNAALPRTNGDIIAIFDIDHIPTPDYLEKSVGHFAVPAIGFVQVMVTFRNGDENWIAQAAGETSLDYYNPTSMGLDAVGGVSKMGTNSLIRRKALEGIGGYRPGLAEDLATSLALHAAGWRSVYVAEPMAPGLAPASISSWFTQQVKWARGVFEVLLAELPRVWKNLPAWQRLCYVVRMTKYWVGPLVAFNLISILVFLWLRAVGIVGAEASRTMEQYVLLLLVLGAFDVLMRATAMATWRHPTVGRASLWRAVALVVFTWPVYTLSWLMAVLRLPLAFRSTPKDSGDRLNLTWILPQTLAIGLMLAGIATLFNAPRDIWREVPLTLLLALAQVGIGVLVLAQRLRPSRVVNLWRAATTRNDGDGSDPAWTPR
jgi:cellulose synthase (UDP-forming)